ncbi:MAG: hypothetical protein IKY71_08500, partial [Bacteroidaceae bacterium]|nr:hypothetical protein [Bacteroidaceae bacterium]
QEIENEKQRKRELMSHFPKTLGTVDETRYVLHDDEKQKQTDYFESKPVSPLTVAPANDEPPFNISGIGEQQSEKPKKDVSMQTAVQGIANFGNKENPLGFGNWKSASTLFGPQKEKNETKALESPFDFDGNTAKEENIPFNHGIANWGNKEKTLGFGNGKDVAAFLMPKKENAGTTAPTSLFDFDGNTAKEENIPFNHGIQFPGLGAVGGNQQRTTTERNDSLGLEKDKIENIADSLKTVNINNNTNTVSNNAVTTKPYIKPGLYGKNPDRDFTNDLRKIKQELPPIAASILNNSGTEIVVLDNMFSVDENGVVTPRIGRYYASKNKIYLDSWHVDKRTLLSEAIHAVQDYLGMTGTGKSNLEFQEHVIKDLYYHHKYRKTKDIEYLNGISTTESKDYIYLINNALDEKGVLDLNKFLSEINYYFDEFQSHYKKSDSYQTQGVKNFNYNWIKLLHIFDIEYKY